MFAIEFAVGSNFDDVITGNDRVNLLEGGNGNDIVGGEAGIDEIVGGLGLDELIGGDGDDVFTFRSFADLQGRGPGPDGILNDRIDDFSAPFDVIVLAAIDANNNATDGNQAFVIVNHAPGVGQIQLLEPDDDGISSILFNGGLRLDVIVETGNHQLTANDIIL
jgi:Ca2+-binding RTX toxin-like protein